MLDVPFSVPRQSVHLTAAKWTAEKLANTPSKTNIAHLYAEAFDDIYAEGGRNWLNYFEGKALPPRPNGKPWSAPHTVDKHVGMTAAELQGRFANPSFSADVASTFADLATAEDALSFFLTAERNTLIDRATKRVAGENFSKTLDLGRTLGFGVDRAGNTITGMRKINVNIIFDGRGGWFVHTAYPLQ